MTANSADKGAVSLTPAQQRAEERARDRAEWAEFDALFDRFRAYQPDFDCFCGSLEDLRRAVADLDRRAARQRRTGRAAPGTATSSQVEGDDPQLAARLAVAKAAQSAVQDDDVDQADRRQQLEDWHTRGRGDDGDGVQGAAAVTRGADGVG